MLLLRRRWEMEINITLTNRDLFNRFAANQPENTFVVVKSTNFKIKIENVNIDEENNLIGISDGHKIEFIIPEFNKYLSSESVEIKMQDGFITGLKFKNDMAKVSFKRKYIEF